MTTGYTREEFLSMKPIELLTTEEDRLRFLKRMSDQIEGKPPDENVDYKIRKKDGTYIWASLNGQILEKDGRPYGISIIAHDITERKRFEEALQGTVRVRVLEKSA